ncbi:MAG: hypothetical protein DMF64_05195 [Acidobacteria bacterium]|nr:MAG: hypothetical protein DMF64_05195 [Acidobacteriota bacterium]
MTITFSRRLAFVLGILTPLAETIRRWHQLGQLRYLPFWLDDYIIGAFLLYGAWRSSRDARGGQRFLTAAWGFTCGMAYASFFSQLDHLHDDPAPISGVWVLAIKGVGFVLVLLALAGSLRRVPEDLTT